MVADRIKALVERTRDSLHRANHMQAVAAELRARAMLRRQRQAMRRQRAKRPVIER